MRLFLLLLLAASALPAQDFVGSANIDWPDPQREKRESADAWGLFSLPTSISNRGGDVQYWRAATKLNAPAYRGGRLGVNVDASLSYLGIDHSERELPPRLIRAGTGASLFYVTGKQLPAVIATMTHIEMRSDLDRPRLSDLKFTQAAFAMFTVSPKWTLSTGLFYTTEFLQTRLKALSYFPLPFFSATWKPDEKLSLTLGLFSLALEYRPHPLFELRVSHDLPFTLNMSITQRIKDWLVVREFFGHHEESYNLSGKRWQEYSKAELVGWGVGAMLDFLPFNGLATAAALKNSYVRFTYQFGFAQRWRLFTYDNDNTRALYELNSTHNFALTVSVAF
ncbi:MAG: hypothetical protein KBG84_14725 [Planctomycetes bacterium]|nr:hypothetical protein [Planctomycetota bacterium]